MAKATYIGVGGVARKTKNIYIGVGGVARKVKKAYIGVGGVARLFYSGSADVANMSITYTGTMIDSGIVTMSGVQYRLLTLTSSGTLSVDEEVGAEVWMCGGGTSGKSGFAASSVTYGGGGGAGAFTATGEVTLSGSMAAVIGSGGAATTAYPYYGAGGASSFGGLETSVNFTETVTNQHPTGINGGTGGGNGSSGDSFGVLGSGDGLSKYPFEDSSYFDKCHCAGGGAGSSSYTNASTDYIVSLTGGQGGTNGGDGRNAGIEFGTNASSPSTGGSYGGGYSKGNYYVGTDGTFYGAGGGGGGAQTLEGWSGKSYAGGAGYQGVIYIRIPVEQ